MKILLISHLLPYPPIDGPTLRNFNLLKETARSNDIYLLAFHRKIHESNKANIDSNVYELEKYCKEVHVFELFSDKSKLYWYLMLLLNLLSLIPYSVWLYWSPKMVKSIKQIIQKYSFDVVELGEIGIVNYAKYVPGIKKLLVHHNIESNLLRRRSKVVRNPLAKFYLKLQAYKLERLERIACEKIDYHTTVSDADKETLLKINPKAKIQVVPNGVDIDYFQPNNEMITDNTLIFAGTMTWFPNHDAMIYFVKEIWPLLKKKIPGISIFIVGKNPTINLIKFSEEDPAIKVLGFVNDIRPWIAKSAVYVVPIRVGGGSRLKILDAFAMGKAIVSTTLGAEGLTTTNENNIMVADSPREFVNKIIYLLKSKNTREKLQCNARRTAVEIYSWKIIAPKLEWVYEFLTNNEK